MIGHGMLAALVLVLVLLPVPVLGQPGQPGQSGQSGLDGSNAGPKKSFVEYVAEPQEVPAGKAAKLELRFHVLPGYHVNSHTPKSEFLIPTRVEIHPADGVRAGSVEYPAGHSYSFSFSPNETLDVYSDDFTVALPVAASRGPHAMDGELKYQACDKAACYPPKTLPIKILFTAK